MYFFIETYLDFYEFTKVKAKNAVNMEFTLGKSPEEIPNLPTHSHNGIKMDQWFLTRRNTLGQHLIGLDGSKPH